MTTEPRRSMDDYGPQDMAIPEWRLLQKVGSDWAKQLGGVPGQFFNKLTDELASELNIVVVDILTGRAKWGAEISDAGPICASDNVKSSVSIEGKDCLACPDRLDTPWAVKATERRVKCCINYTILGIDLDHDYLPIVIRAHGTSALAVRQLITQLKMNKALRGEYFRAEINIKCQEKTTPYGTTFVIHPKITNLITDEAKAKELQTESNRLLGDPIPLPEGRPDDEAEPEPLGYTSTGVPFYSEEQKKLLTTSTEAPPKPKEKPVETKATPPPPAPTPGKETKPIEEKKEKETGKEKPLDLEF